MPARTELSLEGSQSALRKFPIIKPSKFMTRLLSANKQSAIEYDSAVALFRQQQINEYHKSLAEKHYKSIAVSEQQVVHLWSLVTEHYHETEINDREYFRNALLVSERTLQRIAKKAFNMPLQKFLITYRLHKALFILMGTEKTIYEVALSIGYTDPKHFSKSFKKLMGMSPSEISIENRTT